MTPTFRELCAVVGCTEELRAALAQPEPVAPTDQEIIAFWSEHCAGDGDAGILRLARRAHPPTILQEHTNDQTRHH
jgi:hypothetical protein